MTKTEILNNEIEKQVEQGVPEKKYALADKTITIMGEDNNMRIEGDAVVYNAPLHNSLTYIEKLKSEIAELEDSIQMEPEKISLIQEKIKEKYMWLQDTTRWLLNNADSEQWNNPDFLQSINVDRINDVYIHKKYLCGAWKADVNMYDLFKMQEKKGLAPFECFTCFQNLEFQNCNLNEILLSGRFEGGKFENCDIFNTTFENAEFVNKTFKNVTFYSDVLQNVKFENCKFEQCENCDYAYTTEDKKSKNIEFFNTDFKDFKLNLDKADTNLDLNSVYFKDCAIDNGKFFTIETNYPNSQSITKKISTKESLTKLLDKNLKKV